MSERAARRRDGSSGSDDATGAPGTVRLDKWLWAVRLCPTRTTATDLCSAGRVRVAGAQAKPSRQVAVGDEVTISGRWRVTACRVERVLDRHVGASIASTCYIDLTPPAPAAGADDTDWWDALPAPAAHERGTGRPTKRDRRRIEHLRGE